MNLKKKPFNYFDSNYEKFQNILKNKSTCNCRENFSDETTKLDVSVLDLDDCDENYKILDEDKSQYCHKNKDGTYILKSRSEKKSTCSHDNQCKEGLKCGDDDECVLRL